MTRAGASRTSSTSRSRPQVVSGASRTVHPGARGRRRDRARALLLVGASALTLAWRAAARAPTPWAVGAGLLVVCALLTLAGEWSSLGDRRGHSLTGRELPLARAFRCRRGRCTGRRWLIRSSTLLARSRPTRCASRSFASSANRRPTPTPRSAATGFSTSAAGEAVQAAVRWTRELVRRRGPRRQPHRRPQGRDRGPARRGRELRGRSLQPGARALRRPRQSRFASFAA